MDRETGKCKGYGFCEYADHATALSAMRNLNGYDFHGRNLRVDFADGGGSGGDKSKSGSSSGGNANSGPSGGGKSDKKRDRTKRKSGMPPEELQQKIDEGVEGQGPVALYDALVAFQDFGRKNPQHAKIILDAYPPLAFAIIETMDMFDLPTELAVNPSDKTKSSSRGGSGTMGGGNGILGSGPRQPSRPNPVKTGSGGGLLNTPAPARLPSPGRSKSKTTRDPRRRGGGAPPDRPPPAAEPIMSRPPPAVTRDPRRRGGGNPTPTRAATNGEFAAIAEMARGMTRDKLDQLPPEERNMLMTYMEQMGIHIR